MPGTPSTRYSVEFKKGKVLKYLTEHNARQIRKFVKQEDLNKSMFCRWLKKYGALCAGLEKKYERVQDLCDSEKLKILVETKDLDPVSLGVFCRKYGLYRETLLQWREEVKQQVKRKRQKNKPLDSEQTKISDLMAKIQQLEKELSKKDKRLQEVEALLDLKKKVQALLEAQEAKK